jgi:hypothetical protein
MPLYFLALDAEAFHRRLRPGLAESWRQRSFAACRPLAAMLAPATAAFCQRYQINPGEMLLGRPVGDLPFDRALWQHLVGEILWVSAAAIPDLETTPEALACLLGADPLPEAGLDRSSLAPIQQVYLGARDLSFGGAFYRPAAAGYNDCEDVSRLADFLSTVDATAWSSDVLAVLPGLAQEQERVEELELVKEWLPALQDVYRRAQRFGQIIVCETVSG